MPRNHLPINNREQIHSGNVHSEGRTLATIHYLASLQPRLISHHVVLRQSICHSAREGASIPCPYQTDQHLFPLHTLDYQRRKAMSCILPYWWHDSRHAHQGSPFVKSQTFRKRTRSCHALRRSVGIRRLLGNAKAMHSRPRSSTAQTKCEHLGAGAQIDFTKTYWTCDSVLGQ